MISSFVITDLCQDKISGIVIDVHICSKLSLVSLRDSESNRVVTVGNNVHDHEGCVVPRKMVCDQSKTCLI